MRSCRFDAFFKKRVIECFAKVLITQRELRSVPFCKCVCMHVCNVLHMPLGSFTFAFFSSVFLQTLLSSPCRSDARLLLPQPPSCSPKRRSLVSRSRLHPTLSIAYIQTLTSRSRSLLGCRGNGSRSSKTQPKGPNPSSTQLSSLL